VADSQRPRLTYAQVGILLSVPTVVGNVIEPVVGILRDVWKRRVLIVGGGLLFAFSAFLSGSAHSFAGTNGGIALCAP
jgi:FSR family fosmidomycin resistance protein-like MFS transporter